jgi:hypothetical protein
MSDKIDRYIDAVAEIEEAIADCNAARRAYIEAAEAFDAAYLRACRRVPAVLAGERSDAGVRHALARVRATAARDLLHRHEERVRRCEDQVTQCLADLDVPESEVSGD